MTSVDNFGAPGQKVGVRQITQRAWDSTEMWQHANADAGMVNGSCNGCDGKISALVALASHACMYSKEVGNSAVMERICPRRFCNCAVSSAFHLGRHPVLRPLRGATESCVSGILPRTFQRINFKNFMALQYYCTYHCLSLVLQMYGSTYVIIVTPQAWPATGTVTLSHTGRYCSTQLDSYSN